MCRMQRMTATSAEKYSKTYVSFHSHEKLHYQAHTQTRDGFCVTRMVHLEKGHTTARAGALQSLSPRGCGAGPPKDTLLS